ARWGSRPSNQADRPEQDPPNRLPTGAYRRHSSLTWLSLRIPEGVYHSGILPGNNWDPTLSHLRGYLPFTRYAAPDALNSAKTPCRTQGQLFTGTYGCIDSNQLLVGYNARSLVAHCGG